jgi:hypothetical protein
VNRQPISGILLTLALLASIACGGGGSSSGTGAGSSSGGSGGSTNTWVGQLAESDAFIAIMKEGTQHLIYITNGKDVSVWFEGNASGAVVGYFTFYNDEGGSIINNPAGDGFGGTVTIAPGQHFKYSTVPAKGDAGLYRAKDATGESAWIVLADGSFRGAKLSAEGKIEPISARGGTRWTNPAADP